MSDRPRSHQRCPSLRPSSALTTSSQKLRLALDTPLPHRSQHLAPQEDLDWADLVTIDLALYETPEGRRELAQTLIKAVREDGFFYVKNFNISQERVNRQFALGKKFYDLPLEEKLEYVPEGLGTRFPASELPRRIHLLRR